MPKKKQVKLQGTYSQHRERQRGRILSAAQALFNERGIDRTTMADIVAASGVQASTLYEYFAKKDEIVWAIFSEVLKADAASMQQQMVKAVDAFGKIRALLEHMGEQLKQNQARIRFLAQFDALYARHWPVERLLTLEGEMNEQGFKVFRELIDEGIVDGSLRADLKPELTLHAVVNAMVGAQRRLASLGAKVEQEYGQPIELLFQESVRIVLLGMQAPAMSVAVHGRVGKSAPGAGHGTKRSIKGATKGGMKSGAARANGRGKKERG